MSVRNTLVEPERMDALETDLVRAHQDYDRLRVAWLALAQHEAGNEVAIAMVGADMDRAHAELQLLAGQRQLPAAGAVAVEAAPEESPALRSRSRRLAEVDS